MAKRSDASIRGGAGVAILALAAAITLASFAPAAHSEPDHCENPAASVPDVQELERLNQTMVDHGPRPTGSEAHEAFIDWIEAEATSIPGISTRTLEYTIDQQHEPSWSLDTTSAGGVPVAVPVSGAVPRTTPTGPGGVTAPLVYVPLSTPLHQADVAGKIVLRDVHYGSLPMAEFYALSYYIHDPDGTLDPTGDYQRDWLGGNTDTDLPAAANAGAAGILFGQGFPHEQVAGRYGPYKATHWGVPGLFLGADATKTLKDQLNAGPVTATLTLDATRRPTRTRTIVATLPGSSPERIIFETHTDGMNGVWDNGHVGLLALAARYAAEPIECRTRTLEFVFATGHLYGSIGGEAYSQIIDREMDSGTVALVVSLEHLGARDFQPVQRTDGPGRVLVPTDQPELTAALVPESPLLIAAATKGVVDHDLRRMMVMRGAPAPPHPTGNYFGEGTGFHRKGIPTFSIVAGPWTLLFPPFGMEAVDLGVVRRQLEMVDDLVTTLDHIPREAIAAADLAIHEVYARRFRPQPSPSPSP